MKLKKFYLDRIKMKHFFKIFLITAFIIGSSESKANNLLESLKSAYLKNPKLNAERANMRATKEEKRESVSEFLPSVTLEGYISEQDNTNPGDDTNFEPSEQSVTIEQKIFQGGSGIATFGKKRHGQSIGEFKLKKAEQSLVKSGNDIQ